MNLNLKLEDLESIIGLYEKTAVSNARKMGRICDTSEEAIDKYLSDNDKRIYQLLKSFALK
jgi:hypothetical protein